MEIPKALSADEKVAEEIAEAIKEKLGRIRISIDYKLLIQCLMELELVQPMVVSRYSWVNPLSVVSFTDVVPRGVALLMQTRFTCDPEHVLQVYAFCDDRLIFYDEDMVLSRYLTPLTYMEMGALIVSKKKGIIMAVNKSATDKAYFSYTTVWGLCTDAVWRATVRALSDVIADELKLPKVLRRVL
jgi:hypothetical protein